jgi:hypothetical protein
MLWIGWHEPLRQRRAGGLEVRIERPASTSAHVSASAGGVWVVLRPLIRPRASDGEPDLACARLLTETTMTVFSSRPDPATRARHGLGAPPGLLADPRPEGRARRASAPGPRAWAAGGHGRQGSAARPGGSGTVTAFAGLSATAAGSDRRRRLARLAPPALACPGAARTGQQHDDRAAERLTIAGMARAAVRRPRLRDRPGRAAVRPRATLSAMSRRTVLGSPSRYGDLDGVLALPGRGPRHRRSAEGRGGDLWQLADQA